jgi:uncharacterized protein YyaL (SSP411 family)
MSAQPIDFARNNLDRETSPYLLQHRDNPVHWQPWAPEVLAHAKAVGKPILLSVGYAACHWCHVMAHESFEDAGTAAVMNELFVNIKVDREERPDIDGIYQNALALLGEQGGWPLTMFLNPDGEPFWGGTYFPPESRWGRPAFRDLLRRVAQVFRDDSETITKNRTALVDGLGKLAARGSEGDKAEITPDFLTKVATRLLREVDPVEGGIGDAPKFPQPYNIEMLWRAYLRTGGVMFRDAVTLTLDKMSQGGIYDHLGGGYARYSTDARWLVPHFEKMLYDNAQLIDLLCLVHAETSSPLYEHRIHETVGWVLREMVAEGGGFAATQDADSEGEEGKFYVWTEAEIDAVLGADAALFKHHYDVKPHGNWEGHTILNRTARPALADAATEAKLEGCREKLYAIRDRRIKPGWDDKVLADWNGLMIAALADAGAAFRAPAWIAAAERAFAFVASHMQAVDGRLRHAWRQGKLARDGFLDDHANMARAALALFEATGTAAYLQHAIDWTAALDKHYWDAARGGYFYTADDAEALIVRARHAHDNAVPSGNGTMLGVLARLEALTGDTKYRERALLLIDAFAAELGRNAFAYSSLLNHAETLFRPVNVAVVGRRGEPSTEALLAAARSVSCPDRIIAVVAPNEDLPAGHPAHGKRGLDGKATAYVCIGETCSLPVTDPVKLAEELPQP